MAMLILAKISAFKIVTTIASILIDLLLIFNNCC